MSAPDGGRRDERIGLFLATLASLWAACFLVFWKLAAGTGPRVALVFALLLSAASICTLVTVAVRRGGAWRLDRCSLGTAAILALCTVVGNIASLSALATCSPAIVSIVFQLQVFMIAGLERLVLRHRIAPTMLVGAVLAVGGFAIMRLGGGAEQGVDAVGLLWALLAAASFAVMLVATRRVAARIDLLAVNSLRLWLAVGALAVWPGLLGEVAALPPRAWLYAGAAGLCGLVLSRLLLMYAVRFLPATTTKLVTLSSPLFALLLGWWLLATVPGWRDLAGGAVILAGVALPLLWAWRRDRRRAAAVVPVAPEAAG